MVDRVGDANSMLIYDFYRYVVVFLFCFSKYVEMCALKKTLFFFLFLKKICNVLFFTLDPSLVENEELYLY